MIRKAVYTIAASEVLFYGWCKWKIREYESNIKPFNETDQPFSAETRERLVEKLFAREFGVSPERGKKWLEGWFFGSKLENRNRTEIQTFLAWAYFNKTLEGLSQEEKNEVVRDEERIERMGKFRFKENHDGVSTQILRPNMDTFQDRTLHKPLIFYFLSEFVLQSLLVPICMSKLGFQKRYAEHEGRTMRYWYRESSSSSSSSKTPIVFFHGVGVGVLPYVSLFKEILSSEDRIFLAPEFPCVSLTIPVDVGMSMKQTSSILMNMIRNHDIDRVTLIGHSFGVWPLTWLLRHHSKHDLNVDKSIYIDPVNVGVHRAYLCRRFLYDPVHATLSNTRSIYKFILTQVLNRDARIVSAFMRNVFWYDSFVLEELENIECKNITFFFSENDSYMDSNLDYLDVKQYSYDILSSDDNRIIDAKMWRGMIHGEFLIHENLRKELISSI